MYPGALLAGVLWLAPAASAQSPPPAGTPAPAAAKEPAVEPAPGQPAPTPSPAPADPPREERTDFSFNSRAYGTGREAEPPRYVKPLSARKIPGFESLDWLDFGLDTRLRVESRDDDYRQNNLTHDKPLLHRTRLYIGIREIADPFRFGLELQDSQLHNSHFDETTRDENNLDFLQAFGELYFKDALGPDRPLRFQAGRLAFEYLDRRLISRNPWRNTTNNFDGFRVIMGQAKNDWQLDFLAVQPVELRLHQRDRTDEETWFYALIGAWRRWSPHIVLEPYYLVLDQDRKDATLEDREIHFLGLRGYGLIGQTGFDYEAQVVGQFGESGRRDHRAFGFTSEIGYTFTHKWKPRASFFVGYGSGDRVADDRFSERFDRAFGFARPWSAQDYIIWENLLTPKVRVELQPHEKIRLDFGYGMYWLASDSDGWSRAGRRDRRGESGDGIGQEFDMRVRYQLDPRMEIIVGYSHFMPGDFTKNTGPADDSDFFYVETTLSF
ncbi:MAG: alginate export family protein [Rhodospirillales bacterium]|jgi:hypothetical protein|nr:alginate export family protein [Rhodospirillales bacterium]